MKYSVFDYVNYKTYLLDWIAAHPGRGHGVRAHIAQHLGCQAAYVSQVLNKDAHFSPEHGESLNYFLKHTDDEAQMFLLLLHKARAGTGDLQRRVQRQIDQICSARLNLKKRAGVVEELGKEDQSIYYSSWLYAAIHILVSIPRFQNRDAIADALELSMERLSPILDFLIKCKLISEQGDQYVTGPGTMWLGNDTSMIAKHHTNWRVQAIRSLDGNILNDLHLSTVASISRKDVEVIKKSLVEAIQSVRTVFQNSQEEVVYCFNLDFFPVTKSNLE